MSMKRQRFEHRDDPSITYETQGAEPERFDPSSGDLQINCCDCKAPFVFTAGEQAFYQQRNFSTPKRCKPCRDAKKAEKERSGR